MRIDGKYLVPALMRAVDILELVAERESVSFAEIQSELGISKSSAYGLVQTLLHRGCLRQSTQANRYALGFQLFGWGSRALAGLDVRDEALPIMRQLVEALDQTCHLGILDGSEAVYLAKVECSRNLVVRSWVGKRIALQASAMGKALLAWRPESEARRLLADNPPSRCTSRAILDSDAFMGHLATVRMQGYALDDRETVDEIRCVAAPVFSVHPAPVAALSISAPAALLPDVALPQACLEVRRAALRLSTALGCVHYPQREALQTKSSADASTEPPLSDTVNNPSR